MKIKEPILRLTRWKLKFAKHDCLIDYIRGRENLVADAFSQIRRITIRRPTSNKFQPFEHIPMVAAKRIVLLTSPDLLQKENCFPNIQH